MDRLRCPKEDLVISGDYNSKAGNTLLIVFERCEGKDYCKSKEEIDAWLVRKFLVTVTNQKNFLKDVFDPDKRI